MVGDKPSYFQPHPSSFFFFPLLQYANTLNKLHSLPPSHFTTINENRRKKLRLENGVTGWIHSFQISSKIIPFDPSLRRKREVKILRKEILIFNACRREWEHLLVKLVHYLRFWQMRRRAKEFRWALWEYHWDGCCLDGWYFMLWSGLWCRIEDWNDMPKPKTKKSFRL